MKARCAVSGESSLGPSAVLIGSLHKRYLLGRTTIRAGVAVSFPVRVSLLCDARRQSCRAALLLYMNFTENSEVASDTFVHVWNVSLSHLNIVRDCFAHVESNFEVMFCLALKDLSQVNVRTWCLHVILSARFGAPISRWHPDRIGDTPANKSDGVIKRFKRIIQEALRERGEGGREWHCVPRIVSWTTSNLLKTN